MLYLVDADYNYVPSVSASKRGVSWKQNIIFSFIIQNWKEYEKTLFKTL